ncbi:Tat pathway signal protein [Kitasatospora purpeofusca]|uniref:Tat pathway signal protein n=1 Tax=Kitasatospora purpeofusca TaxID=67352 RepID=UPI0035D96369
MAPVRNTHLEAVVRELGWSQDRLAAQVRRTAAEAGADELLSVTRSHLSQWLRGVRPSGRAPAILCEALSRGLGRPVTPAEIGLAAQGQEAADWDSDPVSALANLRDDMLGRRPLLFSALAATVPGPTWWGERRDRGRNRAPVALLTVSEAHVEALHDAAGFYSRQDQRLGGRAGRTSLRAYLGTDVAAYLAGRPTSERVRADLLAAAGQLAYLDGWMAFDGGDQGGAQQGFALALALAAEADDPALAGHILRAQAHQALDLGHRSIALRFADASVDSHRYAAASPRERALLGVVHARALAAAGRKPDAMAALHRAERDLDAADRGRDREPERVAFFAEASLAHESALTLRALGDLQGAEEEMRRSVRTRQRASARTHAVTLGYLGAVQAQRGHIEEACATWHTALDAMAGIQSGRTRDVVRQMRSALSPVRGRGGSAAAELDSRAREALRGIG